MIFADHRTNLWLVRTVAGPAYPSYRKVTRSCRGANQMLAVMTDEAHALEAFAAAVEVNGREIRQAGETIALDDAGLLAANPSREVSPERECPILAQLGCARLLGAAIDLRHARGGSAFARAERKDVDVSLGAFIDDRDDIGKVLLGFSWIACDVFGAERDLGARRR